MLRKDEILERTNNGLNVFRHYISAAWRVGRNFLNPLYEDSKASCNIYFDRKSGTYKMKDFGNDSFSGDCFFLVGHLNGLDCGNTSDFVEILQIIDRDLSLGLSDYNPTHQSKFTKPVEVMPTTDRKNKPYTCKEQPLSEQEQDFWKQYGIMADTLIHYKVCSLREYQSETAEGKPFCLVSSCILVVNCSASSYALPIYERYQPDNYQQRKQQLPPFQGQNSLELSYCPKQHYRRNHQNADF